MATQHGKLPDELLRRVRQQAAKKTKTRRANLKSPRSQSKTLAKAASPHGLRGLEPYIGAMSLGRPTGSDNEGIDADLARAYSHEG